MKRRCSAQAGPHVFRFLPVRTVASHYMSEEEYFDGASARAGEGTTDHDIADPQVQPVTDDRNDHWQLVDNADNDNPGGWSYVIYGTSLRFAINWSRRTGGPCAPELQAQWGDPGARVDTWTLPIRGRTSNVGYIPARGGYRPVRLQPTFVWPGDGDEAEVEPGFEHAEELSAPAMRWPAYEWEIEGA